MKAATNCMRRDKNLDISDYDRRTVLPQKRLQKLFKFALEFPLSLMISATRRYIFIQMQVDASILTYYYILLYRYS